MADELIVKLGADTSEFKGAIARAGKDASNSLGHDTGDSAGGKFVSAFEHRLLGARHLSGALATALGLNLEHISENIARWITGVSKEEEESLKRLGELSDRAADATINAARAALTAEQKYQLALRERAGAIARIAAIDGATAAGQVKIKEQEIRLAENSRIIAEHELEIHKRIVEELKNEVAVHSAATKANVDALPLLAQRIRQQQINVQLAKMAADISDDINIKQQFQNIAKERQIELERMIGEFKKSHSLTEAETLELVKTQGRILTNQTLPADKARLDQLKLISKERANEGKIEEILAIAPEKRTKEEKLLLGALEIQNKTLERQILLKQGVIDKTKTQVVEEKKLGRTIEEVTGSLGVAKSIGGYQTYNNVSDQKAYEQGLISSAKREIANEIDSIQRQIDELTRGGSTLGKYEIPGLQDRIKALQGRSQHVQDFVFNPNYKDAAGQGLFAQQVASIGDPLKLQTQQVDITKQISTGITDINNRLRVAGFGTGG